MSYPKLHIFGQAHWHDETYIVGNREALLALQKAVEAALKSGLGECDASVADGEGYAAFVVCVSDAQMDRLALPYTDPVAKGVRQCVKPWELPGRLAQEKKGRR